MDGIPESKGTAGWGRPGADAEEGVLGSAYGLREAQPAPIDRAKHVPTIVLIGWGRYLEYPQSAIPQVEAAMAGAGASSPLGILTWPDTLIGDIVVRAIKARYRIKSLRDLPDIEDDDRDGAAVPDSRKDAPAQSGAPQGHGASDPAHDEVNKSNKSLEPHKATIGVHFATLAQDSAGKLRCSGITPVTGVIISAGAPKRNRHYYRTLQQLGYRPGTVLMLERLTTTGGVLPPPSDPASHLAMAAAPPTEGGILDGESGEGILDGESGEGILDDTTPGQRFAGMAQFVNKLLAQRGVIMIAHDPPRLVAFRRVYCHPSTGLRVTLHPIPNFAIGSFYKAMLYGQEQRADVDKILCEDGYLPLPADHPRAWATRGFQAAAPFFGLRPVLEAKSTDVQSGTSPAAINARKYDGVLARDPVESKMAFQSTVNAMEPPVDPRARRGVERILSYPAHTSVVVPWSMFHMPYFYYALEKAGFELERNEEVIFVDQKAMFFFTLMPMIAALWALLFILKFVFGLF